MNCWAAVVDHRARRRGPVHRRVSAQEGPGHRKEFRVVNLPGHRFAGLVSRKSPPSGLTTEPSRLPRVQRPGRPQAQPPTILHADTMKPPATEPAPRRGSQPHEKFHVQGTGPAPEVTPSPVNRTARRPGRHAAHREQPTAVQSHPPAGRRPSPQVNAAHGHDGKRQAPHAAAQRRQPGRSPRQRTSSSPQGEPERVVRRAAAAESRGLVVKVDGRAAPGKWVRVFNQRAGG